MSEVARYGMNADVALGQWFVASHVSPDGAWVRYEDHTAEVERLSAMVYETGPGEFSPDGWTWKQAFQAEKKRRNRGLGGLLRGQASAVSEDDGFGPRSAVLSPSDIVGSSAAEVAMNTAQLREGAVPLEKNYFHKDKPKPSDVKKKGALMAYLEKQEAQKAEEENIKRNKMNELYQQRMAAKAAAAQQAQAQEQD